MLELLLACAQPDPLWSAVRPNPSPPAQPAELAQVVVSSGVPGQVIEHQGERWVVNGLGLWGADQQLLTPGWAERGAVVGRRIWVADRTAGVAVFGGSPLALEQQWPVGYVTDLTPVDQGALVLLFEGWLVHLDESGQELARWPLPGDPQALAAWQEEGQWRWAAACGVAGVVSGDLQGPERGWRPHGTLSVSGGPEPMVGGRAGDLSSERGPVVSLGGRVRSGLRVAGVHWFASRDTGLWGGEPAQVHAREGVDALSLSASQRGGLWVSWQDGLIEERDPISGEVREHLEVPAQPIDRVGQGVYSQGLELFSLPERLPLGTLPAPPLALDRKDEVVWAALGAEGLWRVQEGEAVQVDAAHIRDLAWDTQPWYADRDLGLRGRDGRVLPMGTTGASSVDALDGRVAGFSRHDGAVLIAKGEQLGFYPGRGMGQDVALLGPAVVVSVRGLGLAWATPPGDWQLLPMPQGDPVYGREQRLCRRGEQLMVTLGEQGVALVSWDGAALVLDRRADTPGLAVDCASAGEAGWWIADRAGLSLLPP